MKDIQGLSFGKLFGECRIYVIGYSQSLMRGGAG
jgi:hypothetical protein